MFCFLLVVSGSKHLNGMLNQSENQDYLKTGFLPFYLDTNVQYSYLWEKQEFHSSTQNSVADIFQHSASALNSTMKYHHTQLPNCQRMQ